MNDLLFARTGFSDSIEQGLSTFATEVTNDYNVYRIQIIHLYCLLQMREVEYILKYITPNSLIVIDELCRSTNSMEALQIANKICEKLIAITGVNQYDNLSVSYIE